MANHWSSQKHWTLLMLQRIVIPDLNGGVSRQPDGQRFPNQVEEADNVSLHLSRGLEKRAGSEVVASIQNITGDLMVHWIDRSAAEKYCVIFHNNASTPIHIRTIDGVSCTLTYPGGAVETAIKAYLATAPSNLRAITVDDTTIVVNTSITTALSAATASYTFGGTNVDASANAHNETSWEDFDLPPAAINEYWYAKDDALGHPAGWYKSISITTQPWYERVTTPMANSAFDAATMPIRIVQTGATTFNVLQCPWIGRKSGDSQTNPGPSFVGKALTDVCLHRNRLWFSAGENIVGSAAGDFFNFWLDSYASVIDSDPIDVKLSSSQVTKVLWMAPFQRSIVVFTESGQQYEIRSQEAMSPTTVSVVPSTSYSSPDVRPTVIGSQLYWVADKGPWSQVYEYLTDESAAQSVATDASAHVDGYIPSDIAEIKASSSNDILFLRTGSNSMYVNYMFWQGDRKMQSAWCRWTCPVSHTVLGMHVFDDQLYTLSRVTAGAITRLHIDRTPLRNSDAVPSYTPRLDERVLGTGGSFNSTTKRTTFVLPFFLPNVDQAFLGVPWTSQEGVRYNLHSVTPAATTTTVEVSGNLSAHAVIFGTSFDMSTQLSKQYVRDQNGVQAVGALQLKQATVHHRDTGYFTFEIDPRTAPASTRVNKYTGKSLGAIGFITNQNSLSGKESQNFKIMGSSSGVDLYINSDSPAPVNISGIEFVADFVVGRRSAASN
jgi:hypothetical protein